LPYEQYTHINQLPPHSLLELKRFFEDYKTLERKTVTVSDFEGPDVANKVIRDGLACYLALPRSPLSS
jgi:inorganic pyrophosphatase